MNFTKDDIIAAIKTVFDPEIPVNVWDLGLIYDIEICTPDSATDCNLQSAVRIKMTLTSPTCPMAEEIVQMIRQAAESVAGFGNVSVELIWDPPWSLDKMSPTARLELDLTNEGW
ncbi:MAG: iron-sulfur cluster assembly protein [Alphaproteobacteria bacterium]|nr:iron-sulfur cluster assembly protein [Alphaproteobacteria bacterium]